MKPKFATEADLCAAFIKWAEARGATCYAEWQDWDILVVMKDGCQIGIQAKLRLNAEVLLQAAPVQFDSTGPDYRAVLVPDASGAMAGLAGRLGLGVFDSFRSFHGDTMFRPDINWFAGWTDWSPTSRLPVPETATDSVAGSPCPITLTAWKLKALRVIAELETFGSIQTKRMKEIGVSQTRWVQGGWIKPGGARGFWVLGNCPPFKDQHPAAYAAALKEAESRKLPI